MMRLGVASRRLFSSTAVESKAANVAKFDPALLEFICCPVSKSPLRYDAAASELISEAERLAFPIRDGIPILLVQEARSLDQSS